MSKKFRKELNAGTVSLMILAILDQAEEPMYGYRIVKSLEHLAPEGGEPAVKQGTLYPVLRSMEKNSLLQSKVKPSVTGPPRRYYSITDFGRKSLVEWKEVWRKTKENVDGILEKKIRLEHKDERKDD
jgi:PadR family transcriptional regulator PadR